MKLAGRRIALLVATSLVVAAAADAEPRNLEELLRGVRAGRADDAETHRRREAEFQRDRARQAALLREARRDLSVLEKKSEDLEREFQENERSLAVLEEQLTTRMGSLGELFGVVRQAAGDTRAVVAGSLVSAERPDREAALAELGESRTLPTIDQLVNLWYTLQQEATETGKVVRFQAPVTLPDGRSEPREVLRIGPFTALSEGRFLAWDPQRGRLEDLGRQPAGRARAAAADFGLEAGALAVAPIDPSRGQILALEVQRATFAEQVTQGGVVGYVILGLGAIGLALSVWRLAVLLGTGRRMRSQLDTDEPDPNNPLGRVLGAHGNDPQTDTETIELKLDEAILREVPKLERGITTIRVLSVLAPLLGLLGTVTGMIQTFQMITLFGTGDPKLMAGGISVALVTTMLGLMVAIPLTFLHSLLRDRSKGLVELLEEQAAGIAARHAEHARGSDIV